MGTLDSRIKKLEAATVAAPAANTGGVVIYDVESREPVTPVRPGHGRYIWLPDNRRDDLELGEGEA